MSTARKFRWSFPKWILLGLILAAIAWWTFRPREPSYNGKTLTAWIDELRGGDDERRALAREAIQEMGPKALPYLLANLSWISSERKVRVINWVIERPWLAKFFVRRFDRIESGLDAISLLGSAAAPAVPRLVALLPRYPYAAARLLSGIGPALRDSPDAVQAIPFLIGNLDAGADTRSAVFETLAGIGPAAAPQLRQALTNRNATIRVRAASLLAKAAPPAAALQAILPLLRDPKADVRRAVPSILAEIGDGNGIVPALIPLLDDPDVDVRRATAAAIASFPRGTSNAIYEFIRLLDDSNASVRLSAAAALAKIDPRQTVAIQVLLDALKEKATRFEAIQALTELGSRAKAAAPSLVQILEQTLADTENSERTNDAATVGKENVAPIDSQQLRDQKSDAAEYRRRLAEALGACGRDEPAAVRLLIRAMSDEESNVRGQAMAALGFIGPPAAAAQSNLIGALGDPDPHIRGTAAIALGKIGRSETIAKALTNALDDSDPGVRRWSTESLGLIAAENLHAVEGLRRALAAPSHEIRLLAATALGKAGSKARSAIPELRRVSEKDAFRKVREAAAEALKSIER